MEREEDSKDERMGDNKAATVVSEGLAYRTWVFVMKRASEYHSYVTLQVSDGRKGREFKVHKLVLGLHRVYKAVY